MASSTTFKARTWITLLLLLLLANCHLAQATFWTVSSYFVQSVSTRHVGGDDCTESFCFYSYTSTFEVNPTATPTASPVSTSIDVYEASDVTIVYVYLPQGAVLDSDIITTTNLTSDGGYTEYVVPVVYTAPSSCPTPFTVTTYSNVYIPYQVTGQLKPTSTATTVYTYTTDNSKVTYYTAYLTSGAAPAESSGDPMDAFEYTYYVANCRNPTATGDGYYGPTAGSGFGGSGSSGGGSGGSGSSDNDDCYYYCVATVRDWVIAIAVVIPSLFLLGFLESWLWFRRLMLGKSTLRVGTISWIMISLWVLCFTRKSPARTAQDQAVLNQRWANMKGGTRWKLWWKWGFRTAYPVDLLGADPRTHQGSSLLLEPTTAQPLVPGMTMMAVPPPGFQFPPGGQLGPTAPMNGVQQQPAQGGGAEKAVPQDRVSMVSEQTLISQPGQQQQQQFVPVPQMYPQQPVPGQQQPQVYAAPNFGVPPGVYQMQQTQPGMPPQLVYMGPQYAPFQQAGAGMSAPMPMPVPMPMAPQTEEQQLHQQAVSEISSLASPTPPPDLSGGQQHQQPGNQQPPPV
ncbi:hypothetical protein B0H66DRAFT_376025 [Apodospora peruviana]|uniref:Uncharacterized protein n=1 Tax=Apodospora peruviana TaxID=516989 RepID=A0AAE0HXA9_9PEZI|nr:hypothetical protein B0H66DRAFT_376025 [Apodospora peruviana]